MVAEKHAGRGRVAKWEWMRDLDLFSRRGLSCCTVRKARHREINSSILAPLRPSMDCRPRPRDQSQRRSTETTVRHDEMKFSFARHAAPRHCPQRVRYVVLRPRARGSSRGAALSRLLSPPRVQTLHGEAFDFRGKRRATQRGLFRAFRFRRSGIGRGG
jgi:hypothetical protein